LLPSKLKSWPKSGKGIGLVIQEGVSKEPARCITAPGLALELAQELALERQGNKGVSPLLRMLFLGS